MNGGKLLKILIFFLIILQVAGFVIHNESITRYACLFLFFAIASLYFIYTKQVRVFKIIILAVFFIKELIVFCAFENGIKYHIVMHIVIYILLFYFLYFNHKSFIYNKRDIFTLILGSVLFTVILAITYYELKTLMGNLQVFGFFYLLLIYVLLIIGAMHYINIRSEKSLWFFLSMLNFAFSDFMFLIDRFYLESNELKMFIMICSPFGFIFLVKYMITKTLVLKAEEFEGF
ncbi:hypothetical protein [Aquimarina aquimarini]|uniref:hypothetical protein n=1 Tax=Aquimarina aquimarini TaxID=1191734 RepID=UPI000D555384|nr:hypothetical protein [Aquimarina aquimarini]